jgi:hypothetical protein
MAQKIEPVAVQQEAQEQTQDHGHRLGMGL